MEMFSTDRNGIITGAKDTLTAATLQLFMRDTSDAIAAQKILLPRLARLDLLKYPLLRNKLIDRLGSSNFDNDEKCCIAVSLFPNENFCDITTVMERIRERKINEARPRPFDISHWFTKVDNTTSEKLPKLANTILSDSAEYDNEYLKIFRELIQKIKSKHLKELEDVILLNLINDINAYVKRRAIIALVALTEKTQINDASLLSILHNLSFIVGAQDHMDPRGLIYELVNVLIKNVTRTQLATMLETLLLLLDKHPVVQVAIALNLAEIVERIERRYWLIIAEILLSMLDKIDGSLLRYVIGVLSVCTDEQGVLVRSFDIIFDKTIFSEDLAEESENFIALSNALLDKIDVKSWPYFLDKLFEKLQDEDVVVQCMVVSTLKKISEKIEVKFLPHIKEALSLKLNAEDSLLRAAVVKAFGSLALRESADDDELLSIKRELWLKLRDRDLKVVWAAVGALSQVAQCVSREDANNIIEQLLPLFNRTNAPDNPDNSDDEEIGALKIFAQLAEQPRNSLIIAKALKSKLSHSTSKRVSISIAVALEKIVENMQKNNPLRVKIYAELVAVFVFTDQFHGLSNEEQFRAQIQSFIRLMATLNEDGLIILLISMLHENNFSPQTKAVQAFYARIEEIHPDYLLKISEALLCGFKPIINFSHDIRVILNRLIERINPNHLLTIADHLLTGVQVLGGIKVVDMLTKLMIVGMKKDIDLSLLLPKIQASTQIFSASQITFMEVMLKTTILIREERFGTNLKREINAGQYNEFFR
ncbi:MAG: hypothetical protein V4496_05700 [Pseudomonadota bacterium]